MRDARAGTRFRRRLLEHCYCNRDESLEVPSDSGQRAPFMHDDHLPRTKAAALTSAAHFIFKARILETQCSRCPKISALVWQRLELD
jgi:hypothetical protein